MFDTSRPSFPRRRESRLATLSHCSDTELQTMIYTQNSSLPITAGQSHAAPKGPIALRALPHQVEEDQVDPPAALKQKTPFPSTQHQLPGVLLPHVFPNSVGEVPEGRWGPFSPIAITLPTRWRVKKSEANFPRTFVKFRENDAKHGTTSVHSGCQLGNVT
jgi:hypothetical protein